MNPSRKITRKELSALISKERREEVSVKQVMRNEERWGLKKARGKDLNKRVVRYDEALAIKALVEVGVLPGATGSQTVS